MSVHFEPFESKKMFLIRNVDQWDKQIGPPVTIQNTSDVAMTVTSVKINGVAFEAFEQPPDAPTGAW